MKEKLYCFSFKGEFKMNDSDCAIRYIVLLRRANDVVEILGQLHVVKQEAIENARYWVAHCDGGAPIQAEVVEVQVPLIGEDVKPLQDFVKRVL